MSIVDEYSVYSYIVVINVYVTRSMLFEFVYSNL